MASKTVFRILVVFALVAIVGQAGANPFQGEYKGTFHPDGKTTMKATADVIAEGDDVYHRIVIKAVPNAEGRDGACVELHGNRSGNEIVIGDRAGGYHWSGGIKNGHLSVRSAYGLHFELDKFVRKSPTLGAEPPKGAVVLLPLEKGKKADLSAWTNKEWKTLDNGVMQVNKGTNRTREKFGDIKKFHIEFKLPLEPNNRGQGRANSGVYFAGMYEVQVLDSFGLVHTSGDCGGLYGIARARTNACLPPGQWQTYDVEFKLPELTADGKVKEDARITVYHNGILIQDNVEITKGKANTGGPIQLQDHGHPIQYRNIWLVE